MKALLFFLALFLLGTVARAQSPALIYQPSRQAPAVISPLTTSTAQSNQALLGQINSTIAQRTFQHQILMLQQPVQPVVISPAPGFVKFSK